MGSRTSPERVLVTGAAGRIGGMLRPRLARPGRVLRLLDVAALDDVTVREEAVRASVTDLDAMQAACEDVDAIIHLGGESGEGPWERIAETNINGTWCVFEAARRASVRRVVFASSNHAVGFFPRERAPAPDYLFPAPDTYYGVSKVTGEALGSLYHHRYGLDVVCIRIQSCAQRPTNLRMLSTWLSPDDAGRLFDACLSAPDPGYRLVWGVSANTRGWFSLTEARSLGYEPRDDAERYADELLARFGEPDPTHIDHRLLGGGFCSPRLDADNLDGG